jgi:hypothetical protein
LDEGTKIKKKIFRELDCRQHNNQYLQGLSLLARKVKGKVVPVLN